MMLRSDANKSLSRVFFEKEELNPTSSHKNGCWNIPKYFFRKQKEKKLTELIFYLWNMLIFF